jgi:hypothetical protein
MKFSKKIFLLFLFFIAFQVSKAQDSIVSFFNERDTVYLYHTLLDVYTFHFSGVMAIKKLETQHRIIFSTETGATLFDFTIEKNKCKTNYIMKEIENPIFVKLIKTDLLDLVQSYLEKKNYTDKVKVSNYSNSNFRLDNNGNQNIVYISGCTIDFINNKNIYKTISHIKSDENGIVSYVINIIHNNLPIKIELSKFYNTIEE